MKNLIVALILISAIGIVAFTVYHGTSTKRAQRNEIDSLLLNEVKIPVQSGGDVLVSSTDEPFDDGKKSGIITTQRRKLTADLERFVAFDPNANGLYPGALVQGKGLPDGLLLPVTVKRSPITITVSDFYQKGNLSLSRTVKDPNLANINDSIHAILKQGFNSEQPAKVTFSEKRVYSMEQAFFKLNASYKWAMGAINGSFSTTKGESYSKYLVRFVEKYFTVSCQAPSTPSGYIATDADYKNLKKYISADPQHPNPLCYVSSVTYGRELWLLVESSESADSLEAALNASYGGLNTGGTVNMDARKSEIIRQASVQSFIMGGGKKAALNYLGGDKITGISAFIKAGDSLLESDPPQPISYQVSYLSDNTPARVSATTDYEIKTENLDTKPSPLIAATIHFDMGPDGKDKNTGLRIILFDNKNIGRNFPAEIDNLLNTTSEVAYLDFYDNNDQGVIFPDDGTMDFTLGLKKPTTNMLLKDGVLVLWIFPHGHDRWQFTPTLHLKFQNGTTKDVPVSATELSHDNGFGVYSFELK